MRTAIFLNLCFALLPLVAFSDDGERRPGDSLEAIQGEWSLATLGFADFEIKGTSEHFMTVSIKNDRMTIRPGYIINHSWDGTFGNNEAFRFEKRINFSLSSRDKEAKIRIDASLAPTRVDLDLIENNKVVQKEKGIYRLKDGLLEFCLTGRGRPTEFKADSATVLLRLTRVAKKE